MCIFFQRTWSLMSENYDVIIAGCGAAGLYAAINLPSELNILIICKRELTLCNSGVESPQWWWDVLVGDGDPLYRELEPLS